MFKDAFVTEPVFESLNAPPPHLADEQVGELKVAPVHLGRVPGDRLHLDADLLALLGAVHGLVVHLDARHHAHVHELKPAAPGQRAAAAGVVVVVREGRGLPL